MAPEGRMPRSSARCANLHREIDTAASDRRRMICGHECANLGRSGSCRIVDGKIRSSVAG